MIRRLYLLLVALTCAVGVASLAACSSGEAPQPKASDLAGNVGTPGGFDGVGLDPPQPRPSFTLTDTTGQQFAFSQRTAGHPTLLFFGYTNCPDVCPTTMFDIGAALRTLPQDLQRKTYVVFVSTDIKRDTGPVLSKWISNFTAGTSATFVGLRGTQAQVDAAQAAAHVTIAEDGGQTHSAEVLLYGADDYARVSFLQSTNEQQQIAHDLPRVAAS